MQLISNKDNISMDLKYLWYSLLSNFLQISSRKVLTFYGVRYFVAENIALMLKHVASLKDSDNDLFSEILFGHSYVKVCSVSFFFVA